MVPATAAGRPPAGQPAATPRLAATIAAIRPVPTSDVPPAGSPELADALLSLWRAVDARAEQVRSDLDTMPPRQAIAAWCDNGAGFVAVASLAELLGVELHMPDEQRRHAPQWALPRERSRRGAATGGT